MSARSGDRQREAIPRLKPSFTEDSNGWYIVVVCGSITGHFYVNKLDESKKALGKCILAKGSWHSPPEFEALGGKKSKRWRHSLVHQGKPLYEYDLTCPTQPQSKNHSRPGSNVPTGAAEHDASLPPCFSVGSLSSASNVLSSLADSPEPHLVNPVLSFIKAFRLRSDTDSLKRVVADRFSCAAVASAKKVLWSFCSGNLVAANLQFQARRDSDKRSQLTADIEDLVQAFDTLDSSDSIPSIYCEANDLLLMPPLSLDPTAEQVQQNTKTLANLVSKIENLEKLLSTSATSSQTTTSNSYAEVASSKPTLDTTLPPARSLPVNTSQVFDSRACNLILFGLPESNSILELKSDIDELIEYLIGKSVNINDVFRLGKFSASSSKRPRPVLIKLATAWDRKIILLNKRKLRDYKTSRLFIREDVPPQHRFRQKAEHPLSKDRVSVSEKPPSIPVGSGPSQSVELSLSDHQHKGDTSSRSSCPPVDLPQVRSVSPALSHSSSTSASTVLQGSIDLHNDST